MHHSKIVKKWEEELKNKIALFYLPSYSPDRNPDEYLNCDLSEKPAPKNVEKLKENLENHNVARKHTKE